MNKLTQDRKRVLNCISTTYNGEVCSMVNKYFNLADRMAMMKNRLVFLLKCKDYQILPKHILNSLNKLKNSVDVNNCQEEFISLKNNFKKQLLRLEIKATNKYILDINKSQQYFENKISTTINNTLNIRVKEIFHMRFTSWGCLQKLSLKNKFDKLLKEQDLSCPQFSNTEGIVNLTDYSIPDNVKLILNLGPNFNTSFNQHRGKHIIQLITDIEYILQNSLDDETVVSDIRKKVILVLNKFVTNNKAKNKTVLGQKIHETMRFLKNNPNLIITTSDKGGKVVIMEKSDYHGKMLELLNDRENYEILPEDPTKSLENISNDFVRTLFKLKVIDQKKKYKLLNTSSHAPRIRGTPKIHKPNVPLRPIVANCNSPFENLSKFLLGVLKPLSNLHKFNVENSFAFVEEIKEMIIPKDYIITSFDVKNLFTNVPIDKVIEIINNNWEKIENFLPKKIPKDLFFKMLIHCCKNGYFVYKDTYYAQKYGLQMGGNLSVILSDIFVQTLLDEVLKKFPNEVIYTKLYVDDTFIILQKDSENKVLNEFNGFHQRVEFTMEVEKENQLPFLDVMVMKRENKLITDWYVKDTAAGRILHFQSEHPKHMKINAVKNMIKRCLKLSHQTFYPKNKTRIVKMLEQNGYPKHMILKLYNQVLHSLHNTTPQNANTNPNPPSQLHTITYIPKVTNTIQKIVHNHTNNLAIINKPNNKFKTLFHTRLKDTISKQEQTNIVYRIPCNDCNDNGYIGYTTRHLTTRLNEHKKDIEKHRSRTSLMEHVNTTQHSFNIHQAHILDRDRNIQKLRIKEALYINKHFTNAVNTREEAGCILKGYSQILSRTN